MERARGRYRGSCIDHVKALAFDRGEVSRSASRCMYARAAQEDAIRGSFGVGLGRLFSLMQYECLLK